MARPTTDERLRKKHESALKEFDQIQSAIRDERKQCLEDRRFYSIAGAQWEGPLGAQFENKPKLEVNKVHLSVIRIINEYRNNRITVSFVSKVGIESDSLADTSAGLYRADEQESGAEEAYDNAFEEAAGGGFGAWRLRAKYEDDEDPEDERQRICFEPIYDADTCVFFDLNAKKQDKSDAKRCYVLTSMTIDAYREEYDDDPVSWPKEIGSSQFDWSTGEAVFIAELYEVEEKTATIHVWKLLSGEEVRLTDDELEDQLQMLTATGAKEDRTKKIKKRVVHKYLMSGGSILEDQGVIAGNNIPVIPVYGKRWYVDNVERCMGHVRLPKDAQRLKNMQLSKLAELSATSSIQKPILTPEQVAGHEYRWADDNLKNYPYMLINPVTDLNGNEVVGQIPYTQSAQIPAAMAALLQLTEDDMRDLLGNQQQGEEVVGNVSTETAMLTQNRLDMQTFIYMSNMAKAVKRCGQIWLGMAKDIFVEKNRKMKAIGSQDEISQVELMRPVIDKDGKQVHENDFSRAQLDVTVDVGPSSSTKRAATVRSLVNMAKLTEDPETKQVLGAMAMMNMEGEGVAEVRKYFRRKLIKMGVVEPTEQEAKDLQEEQANTPPSPQDEYLNAAAEAERARGVKAQADTINVQATADKSRAQTLQVLTEIDHNEGRLALDAIETLGPRVNPPDLPGSKVEGN